MICKNVDATVTAEKTDGLTLPKLLGEGETPITVCFVCSGNTCRSPMAEAMLNYLGKGKYRAVSAGTNAFNGDSIAENAALALERAGVPSVEPHDYKNHRSSEIKFSDIVHSDMLVGMTSRHTFQLISAFPEYAEKMRFMPYDIPDPFMQSEAVYDKCLEMITVGLRELFPDISAE